MPEMPNLSTYVAYFPVSCYFLPMPTLVILWIVNGTFSILSVFTPMHLYCLLFIGRVPCDILAYLLSTGTDTRETARTLFMLLPLVPKRILGTEWFSVDMGPWGTLTLNGACRGDGSQSGENLFSINLGDPELGKTTAFLFNFFFLIEIVNRMVTVVFSMGRRFLYTRKISISHSFLLYLYCWESNQGTSTHKSSVLNYIPSSPLPTTLNFSTSAFWSAGKYTNMYVFHQSINQQKAFSVFDILPSENWHNNTINIWISCPYIHQFIIFMNIYFENTPRQCSQWTMLEAGENSRSSLSRVRESTFHSFTVTNRTLHVTMKSFRETGL